jgi:hypothetical protein
LAGGATGLGSEQATVKVREAKVVRPKSRRAGLMMLM